MDETFHFESQHHELSRTDQENFIERTKTFLATAHSTETIRRHIKEGSDLNCLQTYLGIHATHIEANPERVYQQDETPPMGIRIQSAELLWKSPEEYNLAGQLRTTATAVGEFENLSIENLESVAIQFFELLDQILDEDALLPLLNDGEKLSLLVYVDEMLTLTHFVKNASGRTNEDFLRFLAKKLNIPFTISQTGFRGQLQAEEYEDSFEWEIESARWIYRNEVGFNTEEESEQLLEFFENIVTALQDADVARVITLLGDRAVGEHAASIAQQLETFTQASTAREFHWMPEDPQTQQSLAECAAHLALLEAQPYTPETWSERKIRQVEEYLHWHQDQVNEKLESLVVHFYNPEKQDFDPQARPFLEIISAKFRLIIQGHEKAKEEYEAKQARIAAAEPVELSQEESEMIERHVKEIRKAREDSERMMRQSWYEHGPGKAGVPYPGDE